MLSTPNGYMTIIIPLLCPPSPLQHGDLIYQTARSVLARRQQLWRVLHKWEAFMDNMYNTSCTSKE